jgi:hypothetical protein
MLRTAISLAAATVVAAIAVGAAPGVAHAGTAPIRCPSAGTPPPGSTVMHGLEVDGLCTLTHVTVNGGVSVDPTPLAQLICCIQNLALLNGSTVNGEVTVRSGSGFVTGIDGNTFNLTHDRSTINGRITFHSGGFLLVDATVKGGVNKNGAYDWSLVCGDDPSCFGMDHVCESNIFGNITVNDTNTEQVFIGDPIDFRFPNGDCSGNTIHGSVTLQDTNFVSADNEPAEIEGNVVTGSVRLDHSSAEVYGNTIAGSLLCAYGSVLFPAPPSDPSGTTNMVSGTNTCF